MNGLRALGAAAGCGLALWAVGAGLGEVGASTVTEGTLAGVCSEEGLVGARLSRGMLEHCLREADDAASPAAPRLECPAGKVGVRVTLADVPWRDDPNRRAGDLAG